jgi:hypothetical protein
VDGLGFEELQMIEMIAAHFGHFNQIWARTESGLTNKACKIVLAMD